MLRALPLLLLAALPAQAQGRAFPLMWDSATPAPGAQEVQLQETARLPRGVDNGDQWYAALDTSARLVHGFHRAQLLVGVDVSIIALGVLGSAVESRLSATWHQRLLDRTDVVGLAVLGRAAVGLDALDLELRAIADKDLGPVLLALNLGLVRTAAWADSPAQDTPRVDTRLEQALGVRYQLGHGVAAGVESLVRETFAAGKFGGTACYAGPTFTFENKDVSVAAGIYSQVAWDKAPEDRGTAEQQEVRHNERFWLRLMVAPKVK